MMIEASHGHLTPDELGVHLPSGLVDLSDKARAQLASSGRLFLPWDVALAVLDAEDFEEDVARAIGATLPEWLDEEDRYVLAEVLRDALPPLNPLLLEAHAHGVYGRAGFDVGTRWLDEAGYAVRQPVDQPTQGLLEWGGQLYRLSSSQLRARHEASRGEALGRSREVDLDAVARLKAALVPNDPTVAATPTLDRESVQLIDRVQPKLLPTGGGLHRVYPVAPGTPDDVLWKHLRTSQEGVSFASSSPTGPGTPSGRGGA